MMFLLPRMLLAAAAIAGLSVFSAPYLSPGWAFSPWFDTIYLTGPLFCEISRSYEAGVLPLMNWSTLETLHYNPHVAAYYPLYLFGWLDFCSAQASAQASDIVTVIHIAIFALTMTSFVRATGAGLTASVATGFLAAALPNTFTLANFPTFMAAAAWLPMAAEGLIRICYRRQHVLGALLLAAGVGLMLTAGPGTNLIAGLVVMGLVIGLERLLHLAVTCEFRAGLVMVGAGSAAALLVLVLSAASTVNLFSHIDELIRWTRFGPVIGGSGAARMQEILAERLKARDLIQLLMPVNVSYAVGAYLLGPAMVLLSAAGFVGRWSNAIVRVFGIMVLLCIAVVFLSPRRVIMLWNYIPGLSHTRHLSLLATPLAFAVSVLAANGIEVISERSVRLDQRKVIGLVALAVSVMAASAIAVHIAVPLSGHRTPMQVLGWSAVTCLVFAALILTKSAPIRRYGLVLLVALQFVFLQSRLPGTDGVPAVTKSESWRAVEAALERIQMTDPDAGRVALDISVQGREINHMYAGSIATYLGLATITHYTSPRIYWKFEHENGLTNDRRYASYGIKYLLAMDDLPETVGRLLFKVGEVKVYRLMGAQAPVTALCPASGQPLPLGTAGWPAGQLPLLNKDATDAVAALLTGGQACNGNTVDGRLRLDRPANAMRFAVEPGSERLLIINMPPYRNWRLHVGGSQVQLYNLNQRQIAALLPASASGEAVLIYQSRRYTVLLWISGLAWLFTLIGLAAAIIWTVRRQAEQPIRQATAS
jgi:hypothetical protein